MFSFRYINIGVNSGNHNFGKYDNQHDDHSADDDSNEYFVVIVDRNARLILSAVK